MLRPKLIKATSLSFLVRLISTKLIHTYKLFLLYIPYNRLLSLSLSLKSRDPLSLLVIQLNSFEREREREESPDPERLAEKLIENFQSSFSSTITQLASILQSQTESFIIFFKELYLYISSHLKDIYCCCCVFNLIFLFLSLSVPCRSSPPTYKKKITTHDFLLYTSLTNIIIFLSCYHLFLTCLF